MAEILITRLDDLLFHEPNTIVCDLTEMAENQLDALLTTKRLKNVHRNLELGLEDYLCTLSELETQFRSKVDKTLGYKMAHYDAFEILRIKEPEKWARGEHEKLEQYEQWRTDFLSYLFMAGTITRIMAAYPGAVERMLLFASGQI